jgi:predicted ATPase
MSVVKKWRIESNFVVYEDISYPLNTQRIVLTGAPATGKTTLSLELERKGYTVFHEQAREIIAESLRGGSDILPWKDLDGFTEVVWRLRNEQYQSASLKTINFYDRTIIDSYAYLLKGDVPTTDAQRNDLNQLRFDKVFILPVWPEIHSLDKERMETLEDCYQVNDYMHQAYSELGYELIEVPFGTVEERISFILSSL